LEREKRKNNEEKIIKNKRKKRKKKQGSNKVAEIYIERKKDGMKDIKRKDMWERKRES